MKLSDIIALAKQGYKPADIKELIELAEPEEKKEQENSPALEINEKKEEVDNDHDQSTAEKIKMLEEEKKKLERDLKAAQEANINKNLPPETEKNIDDLLSDMFREYM